MTTTQMLTATFNRLAQLQADNDCDYPVSYCGKSFDIDSVGKVHCFLIQNHLLNVTAKITVKNKIKLLEMMPNISVSKS